MAHIWRLVRHARHPHHDRHIFKHSFQSRSVSIFAQLVADPSATCQIYISRSYNPYLNLSIEHYLLQKTPADSNVLFLYMNRPCVVLGRNQNPWVEVNLGLLKKHLRAENKVKQTTLGKVALVRRRSGGGTVFHDQGNVNYCVICPTSKFDRDRHALMVARALNSLGVSRAKVNERHDIVLEEDSAATEQSSSTSVPKINGTGSVGPLKVSGSAYKLTRARSLHHGTCLLSSPNLQYIHEYLQSPARPFIKARGVESVRSPVANVEVTRREFERAVIQEFAKLYNVDDRPDLRDRGFQGGEGWVGGFLRGSHAGVPEIRKGMEELMVGIAVITVSMVTMAN